MRYMEIPPIHEFLNKFADNYASQKQNEFIEELKDKEMIEMNDKFVVIKKDDIAKYLPEVSKDILGYHIREIETGRMNDGKTPFNLYLVINRDESYANEIIEIMKRHGHWDDES